MIERGLSRWAWLLVWVVVLISVSMARVASPRGAARPGPERGNAGIIARSITAQLGPGHLVMPTFIRAPWPLNGGFEFGEGLGACRWFQYEAGRPYVREYCPQEVSAALYTEVGWDNESPYTCPGRLTGQPEMRIVSDPDRVRSGNYALMWFTFWRCQHTWLYQRAIRLTPGRWRASAEYQAMFTDCSGSPFGPPLAEDCTTPLTWGHLWVRIGIDAIDHVVWSDWRECYNAWCKLETPVLELAGERWARIVIETKTEMDAFYHPTKHQNNYVDNVTIEERG